ncbi:MAG: PEP/pyruvate-binding domain-containing protein [Pyrinomonadaceae bacterium]
MKISKRLFVLFLLLAFCAPIFAQMSRKPSPSKQGNEGLSNKPDSSKRFLNKIASQADFDAMARVYNAKTPFALPHAMFIIDRRDKNKIYYVNSQKYRFHQDFANAQYLLLKRGEEFFRDVYVNDKRRLIVGTIAWQIPVQKFTFEFWEGDLISKDLIKQTYDIINKSFFTEVAFKPNSIRHEDESADLNIAKISASEISANQEYLALNAAKGVGRIHVIDKLDDTVEIGYNEILVLKELPLDLPPVAGIIVSQSSSPLSHVNLLAKGWNIPNAYIKNANELFRKYDGSWFELETTLTDYKIKPCDTKCLNDRPAVNPVYDRDDFKSPISNLDVTKLAFIGEMRKKDSIVYGSKAANLGEVIRAKMKDFDVPNGFGIPFVYYKQFFEANGFDKIVEELRDDNDFVHNPSIRKKKLEELRAKIQNGKFDDALKAEIIKKWKAGLGGKPVYVRSSSNAEDLGKFSGAGLYSSVNNVTEEDKIIEGVKTVWASVWNYAAYEARERNFVEHSETYMAVLIQVGVVMENGGVMITKDPFDKENKNAVYISATWGHNIAVTNPGEGEKEGKKIPIPEQILFTPKSNSVQVLTRSDQETMFVTDASGGLKMVAFTNKRRVLSDAVARSLVKVAGEIKRIFGGVEQDIEWGIQNGRVYVVQARPYIEKK